MKVVFIRKNANYSKWLPFAPTHWKSLLGKSSMDSQIVFDGIRCAALKQYSPSQWPKWYVDERWQSPPDDNIMSSPTGWGGWGSQMATLQSRWNRALFPLVAAALPSLYPSRRWIHKLFSMYLLRSCNNTYLQNGQSGMSVSAGNLLQRITYWVVQQIAPRWPLISCDEIGHLSISLYCISFTLSVGAESCWKQ